MKFHIIETTRGRRRFSPTLLLGPVMWRCTNGHPNHATEWSANISPRLNCIQGRWFLLPALELKTWDKSCLASDTTLGTIYQTTSLTIHFLRWELELWFARARHAKTQKEIDAALK